MKTPRLLLAILPLALLAASLLRPQAFGSLRFGMSAKEAEEAFKHIHHASGGKDPHSMTAAEARAVFVTNGSGRISRTADFDRACPVFVNYHAEPFVDRVTIAAQGKPALEYDVFVKKTWEDFQDLGDCKFQRKGPKGTFPKFEAFNAETKDVVTDTWEENSVRVELSLHYVDPSLSPGAAPGPARVNAMLTATEIAPPN